MAYDNSDKIKIQIDNDVVKIEIERKFYDDIRVGSNCGDMSFDFKAVMGEFIIDEIERVRLLK